MSVRELTAGIKMDFSDFKIRDYLPRLVVGGIIFVSVFIFSTLSVYYSSEMAEEIHKMMREMRKMRRLYDKEVIFNASDNHFNDNDTDWTSDNMVTNNDTS